MKKVLRSLFFLLFALCGSISMHAQGPATDVDLKNVVMTQYATSGDVGQYVMLLCTGDYTVDDDWGVYRSKDDGFMLTVCLCAEPSSELTPSIPAGTYTMGSDAAPGVWSDAPSVNMLTSYTEAAGTNVVTPTAGTLTVSYEGGKTVIEGSLEVDEAKYDIHLNEKLLFLGEGHDGKLHESVNTTFVGATAVHKSVEDGCSRIRLELYDVKPGNEGQISNGNLVKIEFLAPQINYAGGGFNYVPTGTYAVGEQATEGTIIPGYDDGFSLPTGAYIAQNYSGNSLFGMFNAGSMKISAVGDSYTITLDLTTAEGVTVKGTYKGKLAYIDDSGSSDQWVSSLTGDVNIAFPGIEAVAFRDHGDFYMQNVRVVEFQWLDVQNMKATILELQLPMAEEGSPIPAGTYPISPKGTWGVNTFTPGQILGQAIIGTWGHVKLGKLSDGNIAIDLSEVGPANGGTVTVTKSGDQYTFDFDLVDDALPTPHKMVGSWTGKVAYGSLDGIATPPRVDGANAFSSGIYNLKGIYQGSDMQSLKSGLYISKGKKVLKK